MSRGKIQQLGQQQIKAVQCKEQEIGQQGLKMVTSLAGATTAMIGGQSYLLVSLYSNLALEEQKPQIVAQAKTSQVR